MQGRQLYGGILIALLALTLDACDRVQLLAPTNSTIVVSAPTRVLPLGGSTEVTAFVSEQGGNPVQNGTTVRFIATLGTVNPVEVETRNGLAITTFSAGSTSGIGEVRAMSGGAGGGTTTGSGATATSTSTNSLQITIGAAAVNTVSLRTNPGTVSPAGGTVELIATVVGENSRSLDGIPVTFNTDQGTLSSGTVVTNTSGEAHTFLTTSVKAAVTATAGIKTSTSVTVDVRTGPGLSLTCTACTPIQASGTSNTATVTFTVKKASTSSVLRSAILDFGDGTSQNVGNLAADTTVSHAYAGPSGSTPRLYTAVVTGVDINGEVSSASTSVSVTPAAPLSASITTATGETATAAGQRWTFAATAAGGGEGATPAPIQSYTWHFGDDTEDVTTSGSSTTHIYNVSTTGARYTVTVTARTVDGRTAVGRTEIIAGKFP